MHVIIVLHSWKSWVCIYVCLSQCAISSNDLRHVKQLLVIYQTPVQTRLVRRSAIKSWSKTWLEYWLVRLRCVSETIDVVILLCVYRTTLLWSRPGRSNTSVWVSWAPRSWPIEAISFLPMGTRGRPWVCLQLHQFIMDKHLVRLAEQLNYSSILGYSHGTIS